MDKVKLKKWAKIILVLVVVIIAIVTGYKYYAQKQEEAKKPVVNNSSSSIYEHEINCFSYRNNKASRVSRSKL